MSPAMSWDVNMKVSAHAHTVLLREQWPPTAAKASGRNVLLEHAAFEEFLVISYPGTHSRAPKLQCIMQCKRLAGRRPPNRYMDRWKPGLFHPRGARMTREQSIRGFTHSSIITPCQVGRNLNTSQPKHKQKRAGRCCRRLEQPTKIATHGTP